MWNSVIKICKKVKSLCEICVYGGGVGEMKSFA